MREHAKRLSGVALTLIAPAAHAPSAAAASVDV